MKIVFATNNRHKLEEIREILGRKFEIVSLKEIGCDEDIPETGSTLEENARQKAEYIYNKYGLSCFADDTGLEVDALGGAPGIYSARYAAMDGQGDSHNSDANMQRLLCELGENNNRKARFRTVIALIIRGDLLFFEGIVNGTIAHEKHGTEGFGYDPVFVPDGYTQSFAELGVEVKNGISHRARAVKKLAEWLCDDDN